MEHELDLMQQNHSHSQVAFDEMVPGQQPGMRMPAQPSFGGAQFGTEQQMINQVIEESLKNQLNRPSADYDEEAEL